MPVGISPGKVAIVTGEVDGPGVGAATAVALAGAGARGRVRRTRPPMLTPLPLPGTIDETVRRITDAGGEAISVPDEPRGRKRGRLADGGDA